MKKTIIYGATGLLIIGGGMFSGVDAKVEASTPGYEAEKKVQYALSEWVPRSPEEIVIEDRSNYVIQWGDTLWAISEASGVSVDTLVKINQIANRNLIYAGNTLVIDGDTVTVSDENGNQTSVTENGEDIVETNEHAVGQPPTEGNGETNQTEIPTETDEGTPDEALPSEESGDQAGSGTPSEPEDPIEEPSESETPSEPEAPVEEPTEPETPSDPEEPVEEPTEPETPSEPEAPVEEPTEPETPSDPEEPVEEPTEPETPSDPEEPVEEPTEPETPPEPEEPIDDQTAILSEVQQLTNAEREAEGLAPLEVDEDVQYVANLKAQDMVENNYFDHTSPTYGSPFDMLDNQGISYTAAAENIAQGQPNPENVVDAWMDSPGHRDNILNGNYTHIGVGYDARENMWVQMFIRK